ncbi:MAG: YEATS-associated helix-containing protein [Pseudomonadota bacterium]
MEYFQSDLARFLLVIGFMIVAGALGGVTNYLVELKNHRNVDDSSIPTPSFRLNLGLSVIASFLVPLFLGFIQSDVLKIIMSKEDAWLQSLLIFFGFCLVAAFAANSFIGSISSKILRMAEQANEEAQDARRIAQQTKIEISEQLEEESISEDDAAMSASSLDNVDLSVPQEMVLKALNNKPQMRRSVSGIFHDVRLSGESEMPRGNVKPVLDSLVENGLAHSFQSDRDGTIRYKMTKLGSVELQRQIAGT